MMDCQYFDSIAAEAINDAVAAEKDFADAPVADLGNNSSRFREISELVNSLQDVRRLGSPPHLSHLAIRSLTFS